MGGRGGLIGGAVGLVAAATGAVLVADHRITRARRVGIAAQGDFVADEPDRAGFVRADDDVPIYYEEDGPADAPLTIVLSHGFCLNRNDFLFQRRAIRDRFGDSVRIVAYDHRSHGRSGRSPREHATIDQLGADLALLLDARVPHGPMVLLGHSMGGMTLLALACSRPDLFGADRRVRGVALLSTSTGKLASITLGLPAVVARVGGPALPLLLRGARIETSLVERGRARVTDVAWVFVRRLAFGGSVDPGLVEFLSEMIGQTPVDVVADYFPALMSHDKLSALDVLAGTPLVVSCGEKDLLTPPEHSRVIADAVPGAVLQIVPDAGHQALMERPDLVSAAILPLIAGAL